MGVTIPGRVGEKTEFIAHGMRFTVRKLDRRTWSLRADGVERCRFGNKQQITEDIAHAEQVGTLPPRSPHSWH